MRVYSRLNKKGQKVWFYKFMHNGKLYKKTIGNSKREAERAVLDKLQELEELDSGIREKIANPIIEDFAVEYLESKFGLKDRKRVEISVNHICKFFSGNRLMSIKQKDIYKFMRFRKSCKKTNATVNRDLAILKNMFNCAMKWGDANRNPVKGLKYLDEPCGRTRFLDEDEYDRLISNASDHLKPIIFTAVHTGLRKSEILTLKWVHVFLNQKKPYLKIVNTKSKKDRHVRLNQDMINLLKEMSNNGSEYVFLGKYNRPLTDIKKPFQATLKRAGIREFRFHDLRHTFASHYLMEGNSLLELKRILGHSSLEMVERYSHLSDEFADESINRLNGKFGNYTKIVPKKNLAQKPHKQQTPQITELQGLET